MPIFRSVGLLLALPFLLSGCMLMHAKGGGCMGGHEGHSSAPAKAACPVCGMALSVDEKTPRATSQGKLRYFDSEEHLREYVKDPSKYPDRQPAEPGAGHDHGGKP